MTITNYTVTGMTCAHCVNAVKEEVSELEGVSQVDVELDTGAMTVESTQPVPLTVIAEALSEAGDYGVVEA